MHVLERPPARAGAATARAASRAGLADADDHDLRPQRLEAVALLEVLLALARMAHPGSQRRRVARARPGPRAQPTTLRSRLADVSSRPPPASTTTSSSIRTPPHPGR